jgi:hypothetical protein
MQPRTIPARRSVSWILGIFLGATLALSLPGKPSSALRLAAFVIPLLITALFRELFGFVFRHFHREAVALGWKEVADGEVGIAEVPGLPTSEAGDFGEFRRLESAPPDDPTIRNVRRNPRPPLLGRVVLISAFIGRDGRRWQASEIRSSLNEVTRAAIWIERQAVRHSASLHIEMARLFLEAEDLAPAGPQEFGFGYQGDELVPGGPGLVVDELSSLSRAAGQLGFRDASVMFDAIGRRIDADAVAWIVHPMRSGLSFAVRESDGHLQGVSIAVCYPRYSDFSSRLKGPVGTDPATVAHEILHLFGAEDKYGLPLENGPRPGVTSRDVMRLDSPRLSQLRIDGLTASEIGWVRR